jgi:hypothetical protein
MALENFQLCELFSGAHRGRFERNFDDFPLSVVQTTHGRNKHANRRRLENRLFGSVGPSLRVINTCYVYVLRGDGAHSTQLFVFVQVSGLSLT